MGLDPAEVAPPEVVHQTPWSAVFTLAGGGRRLYLKAVADGFWHELPLTAAVSERAPGISPEVLALDQTRGWLLMRPAGERLREAAQGEALIGHWRKLLPRYVELQSAWQLGADELYHMGVPDRSLRRLADDLPGLIETTIRWGQGSSEALRTEEVTRLWERQPLLLEALAALADSGVLESIDHGDLHDANVFVNQKEYSIIDWGDAGISFPFFSLRTVEVSLESRLRGSALHSARDELRQAYLDTWMELLGLTAAGSQNLLKTAERVWALAAAARWRRAIAMLSGSQRARYGHVLPSLLREVLEAGAG